MTEEKISAFGNPTSKSFGNQSTFGGAFFVNANSKPPPVFGNPNASTFGNSTSAFSSSTLGNASSSFGNPKNTSAFGSAFSNVTFGNGSGSSFNPKPASVFGSLGNTSLFGAKDTSAPKDGISKTKIDKQKENEK